MMQYYNQRKKLIFHERVGFTIIELLIVLAVIALLAALLFPVFNMVRGKAKMTACASNLHQLHTACALYAADYDSFLPAYPSQVIALKLNGVFTYVEQSQELVACMRPYVHSEKAWLCPADSQTFHPGEVAEGLPVPHVTSYFYNGFGGRRDVPLYPIRIDQPDYTAPARKLLLYDTVCTPRDNCYLDYNHNGRSNTMFLDGHLENQVANFTQP